MKKGIFTVDTIYQGPGIDERKEVIDIRSDETHDFEEGETVYLLFRENIHGVGPEPWIDYFKCCKCNRPDKACCVVAMPAMGGNKTFSVSNCLLDIGTNPDWIKIDRDEFISFI